MPAKSLIIRPGSLRLNITPQRRHSGRASCQSLYCEARLFYLSALIVTAQTALSVERRRALIGGLALPSRMLSVSRSRSK